MRLLLLTLVFILILVVIIPFVFDSAGFPLPDMAFVGGGYSFASSADTLYRSTDEGLNWRALEFKENGDPLEFAIVDIVFHPYRENIIFMTTRGAGLWKSQDGGANWRRLEGDGVFLSSVSDIYAFAVSRADPDIMYVSVLRDGRSYILKSTDSAASFTEIYHNGSPVVLLLPDGRDSRRLSVVTEAGEILGTDDGGLHWSRIWSPEAKLQKIIADDFSTTRLAALFQGGDIKITSDGGSNWSALGVAEKKDINLQVTLQSPFEVFSFLKEGADNLIMDARYPDTFFKTSGSAVLRSDDRGSSWSAIESLIPEGTRLTGFRVSSFNRARLYLAIPQELHISPDGGTRWEIREFPAGVTADGFYMNFLRPETMFLVDR